MKRHNSPVPRFGRARLEAALAAAARDDYGITVAGDGDRCKLTSGDRQGTAFLSDLWFVIEFSPGRGRPKRPVPSAPS